MEKEILNVVIGLQILAANDYKNVTASDGVIYAGGAVDTDEFADILEAFGWKWDEDNSEWYILVHSESRPTIVPADWANCQHKNWTEAEGRFWCYDCQSYLDAPPLN